MDGWTKHEPLKKGDVFTLPGKHKRQTFWEWLTRKPRELQQYVVIGEVAVGGIVEYEYADRPGRIRGYGGGKAFDNATLRSEGKE